MAWSRYAPREKLIERAVLAQRQAADATKLLTDMRTTAARPWWRKLLGRTAVLSVALATLMAIEDSGAQNINMETGNDFLPHCKAEGATWYHGVCSGVIRGIAAAGGLMPPEFRFCIPPEVTRGQTVRVVVAELERSPALLHHRFEALALTALRKAWPCR